MGAHHQAGRVIAGNVGGGEQLQGGVGHVPAQAVEHAGVRCDVDAGCIAWLDDCVEGPAHLHVHAVALVEQNKQRRPGATQSSLQACFIFCSTLPAGRRNSFRNLYAHDDAGCALDQDKTHSSRAWCIAPACIRWKGRARVQACTVLKGMDDRSTCWLSSWTPGTDGTGAEACAPGLVWFASGWHKLGRAASSSRPQMGIKDAILANLGRVCWDQALSMCPCRGVKAVSQKM